jgi:uncharacterized RDD family membrane protein YckC
MTTVGSETVARPEYAGIATRAVALAIDAALSQLIVYVGAAMLSLVGSLVGDVHVDGLGKLIAATAWAVVVIAYFVFFWATAGQTPGMRALRIRVLDRTETRPPSVLRCFVRVVGLALAIIPLFAGFLPVLVDDRRRALPDFLAETVVVYA